MSGFFDLQVNGYAGVDFNSPDLMGEQLLAACSRIREDGVDQFLLTLITDSIPSLQSKIQNILKLRSQDKFLTEVIRGFHIEGPFISPKKGYIGAHPAEHACYADIRQMESILKAGDGLIDLVTLAPEMDPGFHVTRFLADRGIVVAAGHTDANLVQLQGAIDHGMTMFTHLGNGCPHEMNRHDNIISRVLSLSDQIWISIIADGVHVPYFVIKNMLRLTGFSKVVVVSDTMSAAGSPPGLHSIGNRFVLVGADGVPRSEDGTHLIGSGTSLKQMATNLKRELLLSDAEVDLLTKRNPRRVLERTS
ncbi:N-acetylglucosamine-6-phosphate deacetylase [Planctomicrobium sp. SH668]|uniref:N-acetylglucosamine-6-phosphate deacetylase n=1 Tax=Planctomicrobium sp. SH668 TaxID=3448126 RepID=UPI003F5C7F80